jgi:hypothetical protein
LRARTTSASNRWGIEGVRRDLEDIAGGPGDEHLVAAVVAQGLPRPGHVDPQRLGRPLGRLADPEVVGEGLQRHDRVCRQQQPGEHRPLAGPAHGDGHPVVDDSERAENPELHRLSDVCCSSAWGEAAS